MALLDQPLLETVKCAFESVVTSSTHVLIKSPDSPLYINSGGIHFPIADIQAKMLINSRLLSCLDFVIRPDSKAALVIILLRERPKPIKKPFSSKLYMFSAVIRYFSITIAS